MPTTDVLIFGLNNTQNRYRAAALADQLGDSVIGVSTQVAFPPDWVQERSREHAKMAAYAVRHCDDVTVLDDIARREKRMLVQEALCYNPHLSDAAYATVLQRAQPGHRYSLTGKREYALRAPVPALADIPLTEQRLLAQLREEIEVPYGCTAQMIADAVTLCASDPGVADRALRAEATKGGWTLAASYFYEYYIEDTSASLLGLVTLRPRELLDLHEDNAKSSLFSGLMEHLDRHISQRRSLTKDVATLLVTLDPPAYLRYDANESGHVQRKIFTDAAADVMLTNQKWDKFLQRQLLSDAQFETLAKTRQCYDYVALHLNSSPERLRVLLDSLDFWARGAAVDLANWEVLFACLRSVNDPLLTRILHLADDATICNYFEGNLEIGPEDAKTPLVPDIEVMLGLLKKHPEAFGEAGYFIQYGNHQNLTEDYLNALVENVPGTADAVKLDSAWGPDIYQRLLATGANEDQILEALDGAENLSLVEITAALAKVKV